MIGRMLGHYRVAEKIGAGGMGEVYRAADTRLGRDVALKLLPSAFASDAERLARFEREARMLASLNHPNIALIHGLEHAEGVRFLVLELVEGQTLAERLARGPQPVEEALALCRQIAEALEAAHERGIIHRDLKPANIKVTPEGKAKVLDFGLAKAFSGDASVTDLSKSPTLSNIATRQGVVLGTAAYMSPEQARGKPVDTRTDIWAFGCVLYELLTAKTAFAGDTVSDTVAAILKSEPDWSALPAHAPTNLQPLLRRCLQKDPRRRLQHIGDARVEIEEALVSPREAAPGPGAPRADWPRLARWSLAGLLVGAIAAGIAVWQLKPRSPGRSAMRFNAVTNFAGVEAQPSLSPDGRSVAFVSDREGQFDIWVGLVTGGTLVRITNDANLEYRPRWSPDGTKLVYARLNEEGLWDAWIVPALGGTKRRILANAHDPTWSADGRSIAYSNPVTGTIWICDASGGNARPLMPEEPHFFHTQPACSRDGSRVAFVRRRTGLHGSGPYGELAAMEVSSGKVRDLTEDGALALSPSWSANDEFIYFASSRGGTVNIWRIPSAGGLPEQITAGQGDDAELDLSVDGKRIVFSTYRTNTNLAELDVNLKSREAGFKWLTSDPARTEAAPAYSPEGKRIAYFTARKGAENEGIWVMEADGSNPNQIADDERIKTFPRWSPDGQAVFYTSRGRTPANVEIRRVVLSGSRPERLPLIPGNDVFGDIASDGRIVFQAADGGVQVFDPRTNQTETLEGVRGRVHRSSPDGTKLAYIIPGRQPNDDDAGLWVYSFQDKPRQAFRGWVSWHAWAGRDELLVVEGKPDLKASLWRVRLDGKPAVRIPASIRLVFRYTTLIPFVRFDAHPDGRRIAIEIEELREADIGMIENVP